MAKKRVPETFPINHDDYHAEHIGRLRDGRQFFLTTPFVPECQGEPGCEFIALFLFDANGGFLEAKIDRLGPRKEVDEEGAKSLIQSRLDELVGAKFQRIKIAPFETQQYGVTFGFIPQQLEEDDEDLVIEFHPGNYMAFYPPWEGDYDT